MKKKWLLVIPILFLIALAGFLIYRNPPTTPISISFDAVKIDRNCNQLDTVPIRLTGEWIHPWFEEDRLNITSNDFDGMSKLGLITMPRQLPSLTLLECHAEIFQKSKNDYTVCNIVFSPDHTRWMLEFRTENVFYVGSTNPEDTLEDLYEYFQPKIIGSWPLDPSEIVLWQYYGRWVTSDGKSSEPVDLELKIVVQKKEDKRDVLSLYFDLPKDFPYIFSEDEVYYNGSNGVLPYYTSTGYTLGKDSSEPELVRFAYDKEKNWSVFVWEDSPEQYLIVSGKPQFDAQEILAHFEDFLDLLPYNE
ncbi:MAG: hypothetical protein E7470_08560 [Ruminococcaceae bacterium]|nr:hypothetical protein [Oscillospiraceae bacterium]